MKPKNKVFIATSLDGYIADANGNVDWLHSYPVPDEMDMGYDAFMERVDALLMGRKTFETVCSFDIDWPYTKPVYVLSHRLKTLPEGYEDKVTLVGGDLAGILETINQNGHTQLYIDGGQTIQQFLREDRIDEMIPTTIPYLLGGGRPLFAPQPNRLTFACVKSEVFAGKVVQRHFVRQC
jgi:dihydrofolate reductase